VSSELHARALALGAEVGPSLAGRPLDEAARAALSALAGAGLIDWVVPERDGGQKTDGMCAADTISARAVADLRRGLSYHSGLLDVMLVMQGLGSHALVRGGSEVLRAEALPLAMRGEQIAAFALTEPGAGSSLADVATTAERAGEGWKLNGHKTFISNAGLANFFTVLARTSGEVGDKQGLSMFFVPADAWGVSTEPFEVLAPHPIGDVRFEDCELPLEFLLGEEGQGMELALGTLECFRATVAAAACGIARRALDESLAHLASRQQFGKPLAANQALRFEVAEMDTRLRAAELLTDEATALADGAADGEGDSIHAVARAKLFATESAGWICDRAVQHLGGLGVKTGSVVERLYREVRALRIYEGTSEIQKLIIAGQLFGKPGDRN